MYVTSPNTNVLQTYVVDEANIVETISPVPRTGYLRFGFGNKHILADIRSISSETLKSIKRQNPFGFGLKCKLHH